MTDRSNRSAGAGLAVALPPVQKQLTLASSQPSPLGAGAEGDFEDDDEVDSQVVDANQQGVIKGLVFAFAWAFAAAGVLLSFVWVYAFEEVRREEDLSRALAADQARLHAGDAMAPAAAVVAAVRAAYRTEALTSLSGYANVSRLLAPHLRAWPSLREVELVAAPNALTAAGDPLGRGSVLVGRDRQGRVNLRTDREDCAVIPSRRGCATQPLRADQAGWFRRSFGIGLAWYEEPPDSLWYGTTFLADFPLESDCEDLCWSPAVSFVAKVPAAPRHTDALVLPDAVESADLIDDEDAATSTSTSTTTSTTRPPAAPTVLVRAAVESAELQGVAAAAEGVSRGEVLVCNSVGYVLAGSDMGDLFGINAETGAMRPALLWELPRPWVSASDQAEMERFVRLAREEKVLFLWGWRVTAHILRGAGNDTQSLGDSLRLVIAIRGDAFFDTVMGQLLLCSLAVCAIPAGLLFLLATWAAYLKICVGGDAEIISPTSRLS